MAFDMGSSVSHLGLSYAKSLFYRSGTAVGDCKNYRRFASFQEVFKYVFRVDFVVATYRRPLKLSKSFDPTVVSVDLPHC